MCRFDKLRSCNMCNNARLDDELTDNNDFSSFMLGSSVKGNCITYSSGGGKPPVIEFRVWDDAADRFNIVCEYKPKFCPNCGREIKEYNSSYDNEVINHKGFVTIEALKYFENNCTASIAMGALSSFLEQVSVYGNARETDLKIYEIIASMVKFSLNVSDCSPLIADAIAFYNGYFCGYNARAAFDLID